MTRQAPVVPPTTVPIPDPDAAARWRDLAPDVATVAGGAAADWVLLRDLVTAERRLRDVGVQLDRQGVTAVGSMGQPIANPPGIGGSRPAPGDRPGVRTPEPRPAQPARLCRRSGQRPPSTAQPAGLGPREDKEMDLIDRSGTGRHDPDAKVNSRLAATYVREPRREALATLQETLPDLFALLPANVRAQVSPYIASRMAYVGAGGRPGPGATGHDLINDAIRRKRGRAGPPEPVEPAVAAAEPPVEPARPTGDVGQGHRGAPASSADSNSRMNDWLRRSRNANLDQRGLDQGSTDDRIRGGS